MSTLTPLRFTRPSKSLHGIVIYDGHGGLMLIFVHAIMPRSTYFRHFCRARQAISWVFDLRCDLYYQILRMSASFFQQHGIGGCPLINDGPGAKPAGSALIQRLTDTVAIVVVLPFLLFRIINVPLTSLSPYRPFRSIFIC